MGRLYLLMSRALLASLWAGAAPGALALAPGTLRPLAHSGPLCTGALHPPVFHDWCEIRHGQRGEGIRIYNVFQNYIVTFIGSLCCFLWIPTPPRGAGLWQAAASWGREASVIGSANVLSPRLPHSKGFPS